MRKVIRINTNTRKFTFVITPQRIDLITGNSKFFASYPFLNAQTGYLTDINPDLFRIMLFILLYNLDEVELPETGRLLDSGKTLISYSGGTDSTALLYHTGGIPVHITRSYWPEYETRQIRACNHVGAHQITTDFERVREIYTGRHGFNIGVGYASMYIPLLPLFRCSEIAFGVVFDDLAFHYGDEFRFNNTFHNSGLYIIRDILHTYGIEITCPLAGYSEILTIQIAKKSGIQNYSSCHTVGDEDACRSCYKCFRKEAIKGRPLNWDDKAIRKKIMAFLKKKPLKMAASTVYAIQQANYPHEIFRRYDDIDVSWCNRVNEPLTRQFSKQEKSAYPWQTEADQKSIQKFVETMNQPEIYEFT